MMNKLRWFRALPFWLALRLLLYFLLRRLLKLPITFSYAQGSEDLISDHYLRYHCGVTGTGTYVDVGCNRPVKFSNTFELYLRGWRGINIDANRELIEECRRVRKEDVSICAAISDDVREVTFHRAKDDAVSTIDETRLVEWKKHFEFDDSDQETVVTQTLTSVLQANLAEGRGVDLLSVDVEGHDLQVLKGLDFEKYRPKVVIIEIHDLHTVSENEVCRYLTSKGYVLQAFAVLSAYFVDGSRR